MSELNDAGELAGIYNNILTRAIDDHAPITTRSVTTRPPSPWFNEDIRHMKQEKRRAERAMRTSKRAGSADFAVNKQIFEDTCRSINHHISASKMEYLCHNIQDAIGDQRELHKITKSLIGTSGKSPLPECNSANELAEQCSEYFIKKITTIRDSLRISNESTTALIFCQSGNQNFMERPSPVLKTVGEEEVKRLIMTSPSKSCELDPVPVSLLKQVVNEIGPIAARLLNSSIDTATVPDLFKHAIVRPLLKKPSLGKNIFKNYRPVSNLPFISKVLENVIAAQLDRHIDTNGLADPLQSPHQRLHATETALVKVHSDISRAMDNGDIVILVMLDLSAAFDTLDHLIMLNRINL